MSCRSLEPKCSLCENHQNHTLPQNGSCRSCGHVEILFLSPVRDFGSVHFFGWFLPLWCHLFYYYYYFFHSIKILHQVLVCVEFLSLWQRQIFVQGCRIVKTIAPTNHLTQKGFWKLQLKKAEQIINITFSKIETKFPILKSKSCLRKQK